MGKPRNNRKYPTYPEIPESKKYTQKYLIVYFGNPTWTRPATWYFVQYPTRPDIEKPYPLGTAPKVGNQRSHRVGSSQETGDEPRCLSSLVADL